MTARLVPLLPKQEARLSDQARMDAELWDSIGAMLTKRFGRSPGPRFVQLLLDEMWVQALGHTLRHGIFFFPRGCGSMRLIHQRVGPKSRMRYYEGILVKRALGRGHKKHMPQPNTLQRRLTSYAMSQKESE